MTREYYDSYLDSLDSFYSSQDEEFYASLIFENKINVLYAVGSKRTIHSQTEKFKCFGCHLRDLIAE